MLASLYLVEANFFNVVVDYFAFAPVCVTGLHCLLYNIQTNDFLLMDVKQKCLGVSVAAF